MSVDVRGLKITIGGKPIVSDADMTIADGERVGSIGSSGSGKSMIAKAMLGLLPLTAVTNGSIDMGGMEIIGASRTCACRPARPVCGCGVPESGCLTEPGDDRGAADRLAIAVCTMI